MRVAVRVVSNHFPALVQRSPVAASAAVHAEAFAIEADAKRFVPVDTGALRSSLHTIAPAGSLTAAVGTNVDYGFYQEYGTGRMAAQPFLRPAAILGQARFPTRVKNAIAGLTRGL